MEARVAVRAEEEEDRPKVGFGFLVRKRVGVGYVDSRPLRSDEDHLGMLKLVDPQMRQADPVRFTFQLVDHDRKRFHGFSRMYHSDEGYLAATMEWLTLHVDLEQRRGTEMEDQLYTRFAAIKAVHDRLESPAELGRVIGLSQKKPA